MDDLSLRELAAFALAAEAAAITRNVDGAADLYRTLGPNCGLRIPSPQPGIALGHVAYYLGLLARLAGKPERAIRHFEQALAAHAAAGENAWTSRVRCELARTLLTCSDDASRRRALAELAAVRTCPGVSPEVLDEVAGLLARIDQTPASIIRARGDVWMLAFNGETCHVRNTKGLRWLSLLLRNPWQEFSASALEVTAGPAADVSDRIDPAAAERARLRVTRALHGAIERIASRHIALGRHLASTVRTGRICAYIPDPRLPIEWTE